MKFGRWRVTGRRILLASVLGLAVSYLALVLQPKEVLGSPSWLIPGAVLTYDLTYTGRFEGRSLTAEGSVKYELVDVAAGLATIHMARTVSFSDGRLEVTEDNYAVDIGQREIFGEPGTYTTLWAPPGLRVGDRVRLHSELGAAVGIEEVRLPVGRLSSLRVETDPVESDRDTYWFEPANGLRLRWDHRHVDSQTGTDYRVLTILTNAAPSVSPRPPVRLFIALAVGFAAALGGLFSLTVRDQQRLARRANLV